MNQFLGVLLTALAVLMAAVVSGVRLKPYMDAGETYTPPTFALYPALIAAAIAIPLGWALRKWQGKKDIDIGPITFSDRQPFIVLWCLLYVAIALLFFPYQGRSSWSPPPSPPGRHAAAAPAVDRSLPLSGRNLPRYVEKNMVGSEGELL